MSYLFVVVAVLVALVLDELLLLSDGVQPVTKAPSTSPNSTIRVYVLFIGWATFYQFPKKASTFFSHSCDRTLFALESARKSASGAKQHTQTRVSPYRTPWLTEAGRADKNAAESSSHRYQRRRNYCLPGCASGHSSTRSGRKSPEQCSFRRVRLLMRSIEYFHPVV